jgi:hypothetical protein
MSRWNLLPLPALDRHRTEILARTGLLRALVKDADPTARMPSCPNPGRRHAGGSHR